MTKPNPQGMKTNYKTRLNYTLTGVNGVPKCLMKHVSCKNYPKGCNNCDRIQGKYTNFSCYKPPKD